MKKFSSTTKGNYHRNSRKTILTRWLLVSTGVIIFGVLFPTILSFVSSVVLFPIHTTTTWLKTSNDIIPLYFRSRSTLIEELEALRSEAALNTPTELSVQRLIDENRELRGLLNDLGDEKRITARVIARPGDLPYDLVQIDKGSSHGVTIGAPVYTGVDTVVGIVSKVTDTYSFITLFTSPNYEVTAFISGLNTFAPLEGVGGGVARVRLPQGVAIETGQLVILPGVSSAVYGSIEYIESAPTEPEQYGYVVPPLSTTALRYVSIGTAPIAVESTIAIDETVQQFIRSTLTIATTSLAISTTTATSSDPTLLDATTSSEEME